MYNPKGKPLHEFMYKACYDRFVMYKPKEKYLPGIGNTWLLSNLSNTCYSLLAGNRLLVYLPYSSSLFIFKDNQMIRRFDLWPKHAMRLYKEEMERFARKIRKRGGDPGKWYSPMFGDFFVDRDDNRFFYLNGDGDGKAKQWLYKFNLEGELEAVLTSAKDIGFLAKRNNLFYGIYKGNIHILKEGKR
ncbi:MAG: hypothetical protein GY765_14145 [bacterium]|nr:hypothetical protein [bacterium]